MNEHQLLVEGAQEWLEAANSDLMSGPKHVSFEAFRHAAELAAKALLLEATGGYPKDHSVAGPLSQKKLLPDNVDAKALQKLTSSFTLGTYHFETVIHERDLQEAKRIATRMVAACRHR